MGIRIHDAGANDLASNIDYLRGGRALDALRDRSYLARLDSDVKPGPQRIKGSPDYQMKAIARRRSRRHHGDCLGVGTRRTRMETRNLLWVDCLDKVDHFVDAVGIDHVGLGLDAWNLSHFGRQVPARPGEAHRNLERDEGSGLSRLFRWGYNQFPWLELDENVSRRVEELTDTLATLWNRLRIDLLCLRTIILGRFRGNRGDNSVSWVESSQA